MIYKKLIKFFGAVFFALLAPVIVLAHTDLLRSSPANGETLNRNTKAVELVFGKELQDVSMNSIAVTDQDGRRVDKNSVSLSEDRKQMRVDLDDLTSGTFTVNWRALSADDHTIRGTFSFKVEIPSEGNAAPPSLQQTPTTSATMPMDHQMPMQESATGWKQSAVRWVMYLAAMTLFGGFAFRLLVLKPSFESARDLTPEERKIGVRQGESRFIALNWLSLLVLAASVFASLVLQTSTALAVSLTEAFSPSRLYQVIAETSFGIPWLVQSAAVAALFVVTALVSRQLRAGRSEHDGPGKDPKLLWVCLILGLVVFLPISLTGHARAAAAEYRFAIVSDWLHLVGVGVWVGGLFHMALTLPAASLHLQGVRKLCVVSRVIPLFSRLAIGATVLIVLTGVYNSWIHVDSLSALWNTSYGQVLSLKVILFLPMIALGGINTFVLAPRAKRMMAQAADENRPVDRSFFRSVRVEAAIGLIVLLLAAILVFVPPARQHEMQMPGMEMSN